MNVLRNASVSFLCSKIHTTTMLFCLDLSTAQHSEPHRLHFTTCVSWDLDGSMCTYPSRWGQIMR